MTEDKNLSEVDISACLVTKSSYLTSIIGYKWRYGEDNIPNRIFCSALLTVIINESERTTALLAYRSPRHSYFVFLTSDDLISPLPIISELVIDNLKGYFSTEFREVCEIIIDFSKTLVIVVGMELSAEDVIKARKLAQENGCIYIGECKSKSVTDIEQIMLTLYGMALTHKENMNRKQYINALKQLFIDKKLTLENYNKLAKCQLANENTEEEWRPSPQTLKSKHKRVKFSLTIDQSFRRNETSPHEDTYDHSIVLAPK